MATIRAFDLFCGAGGSSYGAQAAGVKIVGGLDLDELAGKTFCDNFPDALFVEGRAEKTKLGELAQRVGRIDLLLASPECTSHSNAKGNETRLEESRETAFQVIRYARALQPRWIVIENVVQMRKWSRYDEVLARLRRLGYKASEHVLNAVDFGVPQARRRLFILLDKTRTPPSEIKPARRVRPKAAADFVSLNGKYDMTPLRSKTRAKATLARAKRAIAVVGRSKPFLIVYYGSDGAGGWQRLQAPLRTVTTLDRFALVRRQQGKHLMRMLQVPELKKAMGFDRNFRLNHGVRRDKIHLLGNAVCPPVMQAIVRSLCASAS